MLWSSLLFTQTQWPGRIGNNTVVKLVCPEGLEGVRHADFLLVTMDTLRHCLLGLLAFKVFASVLAEAGISFNFGTILVKRKNLCVCVSLLRMKAGPLC